MVVIWDDHEVDNNYARWTRRRSPHGRYRTWFEHLPVRLPARTAPSSRSTAASVGAILASFHMLDGRGSTGIPLRAAAASATAPSASARTGPCSGASSSSRPQRPWPPSDAVWDVVGQPVVFSPLPFGASFNNDQWDGYPQQRERVWSMLRERPNPVIVTGDIHAAGVVGLHETLGDVTTPVVGTELVGTSISSRSSTPS